MFFSIPNIKKMTVWVYNRAACLLVFFTLHGIVIIETKMGGAAGCGVDEEVGKMAVNTDPALQKQLIYSVYVRNHTKEGTFRAIIPDLDRIKDLGTDIIWFLPIHPIGVLNHKGSLGCPYANRDYRSVNPEYGTIDDFKALVDAIHEKGMRCMIDVVYNHTSPDSVLWNEHPEFFYKKADGKPGNHVGEWTDVIDLDYNVPELWDYQIESLRYWAHIVDGFRCDVASFIPVEFWARTRREIAEFRPDFVWLAESVHRGFSVECRRRGMYAATDTEAFEAFDIEYEYDVREAFDKYVDGKGSLSHWMDLLCFQDFAYPKTYNKLRYLENHDTERFAPRAADELSLKNFTALIFFLKGTTMLYGGQEVKASHRPSLFDSDPVDWEAGGDISPLIRRLADLKKETLSPDDIFAAKADDEKHIAVLTRDDRINCKTGIFSFMGLAGNVPVDLQDGDYDDLLGGGKVTVKDGMIHCGGEPVWISAPSNTEV